MSTYTVKIVYKDDKDLIVHLPAEEYEKFITDVKSGIPFWNSTKSSGFFTDQSNIRYMQFAPHYNQDDPVTDTMDNIIDAEIKS